LDSFTSFRDHQIPQDTRSTRSSFKQIQGVDKFLERCYKAMLDREETSLMRYNAGKSIDKQKTLADVVSSSYAY